ncbi:MAG: HD domain-containing protein [Desulfobacteraceae bacterium]|nr:HD domain-containing protein [Desulfobacteraceae bacterium]
MGKVGIPDKILLKPGRLTDEEFQTMKQHTIIGKEALKKAAANIEDNNFLKIAQKIACSHHEKWDGNGYPHGLKGDTIPIAARLMALADVYDALISKRVYKEAFSHEKAKRILIEGRDNHFDPDVLDAFIAIENTFVSIAAEFSETK